MHSCIHYQISQDYLGYRSFFQGSNAGSNINFQKPLEISRAATHVVLSMHFNNTAISETKNKKTKKIKLRLKMLIGLQTIYLLNVKGMSSKSSFATHATSKSLSFPSEKKAVESFLTLS